MSCTLYSVSVLNRRWCTKKIPTLCTESHNDVLLTGNSLVTLSTKPIVPCEHIYFFTCKEWMLAQNWCLKLYVSSLKMPCNFLTAHVPNGQCICWTHCLHRSLADPLNNWLYTLLAIYLPRDSLFWTFGQHCLPRPNFPSVLLVCPISARANKHLWKLLSQCQTFCADFLC